MQVNIFVYEDISKDINEGWSFRNYIIGVRERKEMD